MLAFGDATNDAEMLAWAWPRSGSGNAIAAAIAAADEVSPSNKEDGVAQVLEKLLPNSRPCCRRRRRPADYRRIVKISTRQAATRNCQCSAAVASRAGSE